MSIGEICNRNVVMINRESTVEEAARLMREYHVGDLVVVEEQGDRRIPVGILTDRDIVVELTATGLKADAFIVADVMSFELVSVCEDDDLLQTIETMRTKAVRRVPVVDRHGGLVGILTADDLIDVLGEMLNSLSTLVTRQQQREHKLRR